jgi:hypothetical protein
MLNEPHSKIFAPLFLLHRFAFITMLYYLHLFAYFHSSRVSIYISTCTSDFVSCCLKQLQDNAYARE